MDITNEIEELFAGLVADAEESMMHEFNELERLAALNAELEN